MSSPAPEVFGFQAEISQLLDLIISEYSPRSTFRATPLVLTSNHYCLFPLAQTPSTPTRRSSCENLFPMVRMLSTRSDTPLSPTLPSSTPRRNCSSGSLPMSRLRLSPSGILVLEVSSVVFGSRSFFLRFFRLRVIRADDDFFLSFLVAHF